MAEEFYHEVCIVGSDNDIIRAARILTANYGCKSFKHILQHGKLNILQFVNEKKFDTTDWSNVFFAFTQANIKHRRFSLKHVQAKINLRNGGEDPRVLEINKQGSESDTSGLESPVL